MEAIDSGSQGPESQSSQEGGGDGLGSQQAGDRDDAEGDGLLSTEEYALAHHRWLGEVAAAGAALERRGVDEGEAGRQDAYVRMLERAREKGGSELSPAVSECRSVEQCRGSVGAVSGPCRGSVG
jgi:hypothetical protein